MNKAEKKRILDFAYNVLHGLFNDEKIDVFSSPSGRKVRSEVA